MVRGEDERIDIPEDTLFGNAYDIIKHSAHVHGSLLDKTNVISDDFVLAVFDKTEKVYLQEQMRTAMIVYQVLKPLDQDTATRVYAMLTHTPQMLAILNRNVDKNHLIKIINQMKEEIDKEMKEKEEDEKIKRSMKSTNEDDDGD